MSKIRSVLDVGFTLIQDDNEYPMAVGSEVELIIAGPRGEDVTIAGTIAGCEIGSIRALNTFGRIYDGVPTYRCGTDAKANIKNVTDHYEVTKILVDVAAEDAETPNYKVIPVEKIRSINGTFVGPDGEIITTVDAVEEAQAILDDAGAGTTVILKAGEYDKLYLRQSESQSEVVWTSHGGGALGKNTYGRLRTIEDLTIKADGDVVVSHIIVEGGKFSSSNEHSNSAVQPILDSYIALKNVVVEGVTFKMTDNKSGFYPLQTGATSVDGLTFKNCKFIGSGDAANTNERALYWSSSIVEHKDLNDEVFHTSIWKNITFENCEGVDLHQFVELRHCENLKIVNCSFENTRARDILLANTSGGFSGEIEIVGNKSVGSTERFLRASGVTANMNVSDNEIVDYAGADDDFIKIDVLEGGVVTGSGNTFDGEAVEFIDNYMYVPGKEPVAEEEAPVEPETPVEETPAE